jgi:signal peptidase I
VRGFLRDTLLIVLIAAAIVAGQRAIIPKIVVDGPSMNNTLHNGEQIIINKITYKLRQPERGDVIVFYPPTGGSEPYIKRIIGLPGESVEIDTGKVYIHRKDGSVIKLVENYLDFPANGSYKGTTIPPDHYFVLGDNRINSSDSRAGWTVPFKNIVGKAWLSVWPVQDWGLVINYLANEQ